MAPDLRTSLHAVAVERDIVRVGGPDAIAYLQGQLSQDVEDLAPGRGGVDVRAAADRQGRRLGARVVRDG